MNKPILSTLIILSLISGAAFAERRPHDPGVNARQFRQQQRLHQGIRSGELTAPEARELRRERNAVRREERVYKSDGVLTREERRDLHQDLNDLSRDIYREKHDADQRPR